MIKFPCRCAKCRSRKTFDKNPKDYIRRPQCFCGGNYYVDEYRRTTENKKNRCDCDGYHFPHRKGSKWCKHYKGDFNEEELNERQPLIYDDLLGNEVESIFNSDKCEF